MRIYMNICVVYAEVYLYQVLSAIGGYGSSYKKWILRGLAVT